MSLIRPTLSAVIAANRKGLAVPGDQAWDSHKVGNGYFPLLDYSQADTFTRATEAAFVDPRPPANGGTGSYAWDFVGGSAAANWKASGAARIFADGAILIEGARTNLIAQSQAIDGAPWSGSGSVTANDGTAPDASATAEKIKQITDTAPANGRRFDNSAALNTGATTIGSAYIQKVTGSAASIRAGAAGNYVDIVPAAEWQRSIELCIPGAGAALVLFQNAGADAGVAVVNDEHRWWGAQWEVGAFPTSPIRTTGSAGTRAQDVLTIPQADIDEALFTVGFEIDYWPECASGASFPLQWLLNAGASSSYERLLAISTGGSNIQIRLRVANPDTTDYSVAVGHVVGDKITIRVEHDVAMTVSRNGAPVGSVSLVGKAAWTPADLTVGSAAVSHASPAFGVLSRVRAL